MTRKPVFEDVKRRFGSRFPYAAAVGGMIGIRLLSAMPAAASNAFTSLTWSLPHHLGIHPLRSRERQPEAKPWDDHEREYVKWASSPLPEGYRDAVKAIAADFDRFSRANECAGMVLDVGCGTDKIGAMTYAEFFGADESTRPNWVGVDPLPGRCTVRAVAERLPFKDGAFEKVVAKTSMDHFIDLDGALSEMRRVGSEMDLWFTESRDETDRTHAYRVSLSSLAAKLPIIESFREPFRGSPVSDTVFVKAGRGLG